MIPETKKGKCFKKSNPHGLKQSRRAQTKKDTKVMGDFCRSVFRAGGPKANDGS